MPPPRKRAARKPSLEQELAKAAADLARLVARACRSVAHLALRDWPYVLAYLVLVALLYAVVGVRYVHRGPDVPMLAAAALVLVLVAVIRHPNGSGRRGGSGALMRQAEGVVTYTWRPTLDVPSPAVAITGSSTKTRVRIAPLPYRAVETREFEQLWHDRVRPLDGMTGWKFAWDLHDNQVAITPFRELPLPERVELPDGALTKPGGPGVSELALRLGVYINQDTGELEWVWWDPDAADPHALVVGPTKSGKSVELRILLVQALAGGWDIAIADPKGVDYKWARNLPGVRHAARDEAFLAIDWAHEEMLHRQRWLDEHGGDSASNLAEVPNNPFSPMLVIIDETAELMQLSGDAEDPKEAKARRAQTEKTLGSLIRLARFVHILVCPATQRPDVKFIAGEIKDNLGTRVLTGEGKQQHKLMAFESVQMRRFPEGYPRGRARVSIGGNWPPVEMQVPWISVDEVLAAYQTPAAPEPDGAPTDAGAPAPPPPVDDATPDADQEPGPPSTDTAPDPPMRRPRTIRIPPPPQEPA